MRSRGTRSNNETVTRMQGGHISPMGEIENKLAAMIIQMVCIRYPMTPSSCL